MRYQNNLKKHTYNDYTEESSNDYDMWLENPDWKVLPTISFVDGYPRVLTYKYHDDGCNLVQIHCYIWRTDKSSPVSDQVFHAVVKPRITKHMKVGYNSTG